MHSKNTCTFNLCVNFAGDKEKHLRCILFFSRLIFVLSISGWPIYICLPAESSRHGFWHHYASTRATDNIGFIHCKQERRPIYSSDPFTRCIPANSCSSEDWIPVWWMGNVLMKAGLVECQWGWLLCLWPCTADSGMVTYLWCQSHFTRDIELF